MIDLLASVADCMCHQDALHGALKTRSDLERYQTVFDQTKPDLIIETGTLAGASALWFADHADCDVITVDLQPQLHAEIVAAWKGRVTMIYGSSTDLDVVAQIRHSASLYGRVMVVLDSDHTAEHVYRELAAYSPLVTPGCYCVVEDTLVRWMPWFKMGDGPLGAVEEYLDRHGEGWEVDRTIEDLFPTSQSPSGWLRRTE